jgi:hypothetical protein
MPRKEPNLALPLEIWHMILEYSISIPYFLDPDGMVDRFPPWVIAERGLCDSALYYEAERTRNALRRVCRSWNEHLQRYAHRFVYMTDVVHGNVPAHYLKSAIRIAFDDHQGFLCKNCKSEAFERYLSVNGHGYSYYTVCRDILGYMKPFKAQIWDLEIQGHEAIGEYLSPGSFPDLARVQAYDRTIDTEAIIDIITSLPSLHHIYTCMDWPNDEQCSLKSSTLTTLHISICFSTPSSMPSTWDALDIPALRNLYIEDSWYNWVFEYDEPAWMPFVKRVGKGLRTLWIPDEQRCIMKEVPGEIWSLCPKLEDFFPFMLPPTTPPPAGHPIHTLGVSQFRVTPRRPLDETVPDWPGLRTIRMDVSWDHWISYCGETLMSLRKWPGSTGLFLEDNVGEPLADYLARVASKGDES